LHQATRFLGREDQPGAAASELIPHQRRMNQQQAQELEQMDWEKEKGEKRFPRLQPM
jgi:hypothetical protein